MQKNKFEGERIKRLKEKFGYALKKPMVKQYLEWIKYSDQEKAKCFREWDAYYKNPMIVQQEIRIPKPNCIDPYEMQYGWDIDVYRNLKDGIDKLSGGGDIYDDAREIFG